MLELISETGGEETKQESKEYRTRLMSFSNCDARCLLEKSVESSLLRAVKSTGASAGDGGSANKLGLLENVFPNLVLRQGWQ
jgi:hypothetical protein